MIAVSRDRFDSSGSPIGPNDDWKNKAGVATRDALRRNGGHNFRDDIYGADIVRTALRELFFDKCAYCEMNLSDSFDVDHYRPKGAVANVTAHPGYYWLAYEWANLLPSCPSCNQRRREVPTWESPTRGGIAGKGTQFPLFAEDKRAWGPSDDLTREDPLLLNPCDSAPERHFTFNGYGEIQGTDIYGKKTIKICHLDRVLLRKKRLRVIEKVIRIIETIWQLREQGKAREYLAFQMLLNTSYLADDCEFAAVARCVVSNPEQFGLESS